MVRRRRDEPRWPFLLLSCVLLVGIGVVAVVTGSFGAGEEAPVGEAASAVGSADGVPVEDSLAEDVPVDEALAGGSPAGPESELRVPTPNNRVRVEVLNGGGVAGVAGTATDILRRRGFDVVYFGNELSFGRDSPLVLDRTRMEGAMEAVSEGLGIAASRAESDSTRLVDITVFLGTDWQPPLPLPGRSDIAGPEASGEGEDGSLVGRPWSWRNLLRFIEGVL